MGDNEKVSVAERKLGGNIGKIDISLRPLLECSYTMKALQNSSHINELTWDTKGDDANYNEDGAITMCIWHRYGISCCRNGDSETPKFIIGDYDDCVGDTGGNKNFKAVMIRGDYKIGIPPYTKASVMATMALSIYKDGGETSSTWVGGLLSDATSWQTVRDGSHVTGQWATRENSGVLPANNADYLSVVQKNDKDYWADNLGVINYCSDTKENMCRYIMEWHAAPIFAVSSVEKASTINQVLVVQDYVPGKNLIDADVVFQGRIMYSGEGIDPGEEQTYTFSYKQPAAAKFRSVIRDGYKHIGWRDENLGKIYPPTCYFNEERGIKLIAQWAEVSVSYTVEHYLQNADGSYPSEPYTTAVYRNLTDSPACPPAKEYAGYGKPEWEEQKIKGDGSTVVKCYYPLMKYPIEFCANGGTFKKGGDFLTADMLYSERVMTDYPELEKREGYIFDHWEPELPTYMPAKKFTTRAVWVKKTNYYVDYLGEGATGGQMAKQTMELNQYETLEANTYVRQYTVQFAIDEKQQMEPKTAEYRFEGWAKSSGGPKAYNDGEIVCNLTYKAGETVNLYAVWSPGSVTLPQIKWEDRYFDGWYKDPECTTKAGKPGESYTPEENVTLYAQTISKEIEDLGWYQNPEEPVDTRRIYAQWRKDGRIKYYEVHLWHNGSAVYFNANTLPEGVKLTKDGGILVETKNFANEMISVDMTEIFKLDTKGGVYAFTVQPVIDGVETGSSNIKPEINALARPENLRWEDDYTAVWDSVEGAEYYLLWLINKDGELPEESFDLNDYTFDVVIYDKNCIRINASGKLEESKDLSEIFDEVLMPMGYQVLAYSDEEILYTPQYEKLSSTIVS